MTTAVKTVPAFEAKLETSIATGSGELQLSGRMDHTNVAEVLTTLDATLAGNTLKHLLVTMPKEYSVNVAGVSAFCTVAQRHLKGVQLYFQDSPLAGALYYADAADYGGGQAIFFGYTE